MRPVLGRSALPSNLIVIVVTFPGSSTPIGLLVIEKLGLSNIVLNSVFSFNGFLKSIPIGLAPFASKVILIGP